MKLTNPVIITSRLLPGVQIGNATIQLEYHGTSGDGRTVYKWTIDLTTGNHVEEFSGTDLKSGVGGGDLNHGFSSLFSFLGAYAEAISYGETYGEHTDLFPKGLKEWAIDNSDEITMMGMDFEKQTLIEE